MDQLFFILYASMCNWLNEKEREREIENRSVSIHSFIFAIGNFEAMDRFHQSNFCNRVPKVRQLQWAADSLSFQTTNHVKWQNCSRRTKRMIAMIDNGWKWNDQIDWNNDGQQEMKAPKFGNHHFSNTLIINWYLLTNIIEDWKENSKLYCIVLRWRMAGGSILIFSFLIFFFFYYNSLVFYPFDVYICPCILYANIIIIIKLNWFSIVKHVCKWIYRSMSMEWMDSWMDDWNVLFLFFFFWQSWYGLYAMQSRHSIVIANECSLHCD